MAAFVELKNACEDDFEVEFEVVPSIDLVNVCDERRKKIARDLENIESQREAVLQRVNELNADIDRLTNHADGIDYAIAVTCGIITGIFDAVIVGEWDFKNAKAISNQQINEKVMDFAKKDPGYVDFLGKKRTKSKDPNRLDNAIEFLEKKYKLPGDGEYKPYKDYGITDKTHHLDDFCHHPTLVGLVCCILVQFTGIAKYRSSSGEVIKVPIEVNEYGNLVSQETWGKFFAGIINWFFNVAKTIKNRKGHLLSDMAGSSTAVGKGNEGAGIPGSFLATAKELAALPCFEDTNFAENLRKAYQNGIGVGKKQLDLGAFNSLFQGASSKVDMRTEMAVKHELKRQAVPVIINELLVRGLYFIRRFIMQMKQKHSIAELDWREVMPFRNRTIVRMMTVASGTFTAIDMADAAIRSAIKSGGFNAPAFLSNMILRVNFVGVGRFAVAVATDAGMGLKRNYLRGERMKLYSELIFYTDAKVFYKQADMWISAENAGEAIEKAYEMMETTTAFLLESMHEMGEDLNKIGTYIPEIKKKNERLLEDMNDILTWG